MSLRSVRFSRLKKEQQQSGQSRETHHEQQEAYSSGLLGRIAAVDGDDPSDDRQADGRQQHPVPPLRHRCSRASS